MKRIAFVGSLFAVLILSAGCATTDLAGAALRTIPFLGETLSEGDQADSLERIAKASEYQAWAVGEIARAAAESAENKPFESGRMKDFVCPIHGDQNRYFVDPPNCPDCRSAAAGDVLPGDEIREFVCPIHGDQVRYYIDAPHCPVCRDAE